MYNADVFDMFLQKEEYITASEFLRRRDAGELSPEDIQIVLPSAKMPFGGFKVKLKEPRYSLPNLHGTCHVE